MNSVNMIRNLGLAASLAASVALPSTALAEMPPAVVEVATAELSESGSVLRLPGTVISTRDSRIAAELAGRLTWIAQVGDEVKAGEPVAIIDGHLLELQLRNDEAEIARIQADIDYNERQHRRLERLASQNNMAESELDQVGSQLDMLRQDLAMARVARDRTRYDIERSRVPAPFDGIVAAREMSLGEYTSVGNALVRLVDVEALEVSVNAPLRAVPFNRVGDALEVETDGEYSLATVRGVVPVGDSRSRMMELRLTLPVGSWQIGQAVTVQLPEAETAIATSVPRDALVLRDGQVYVFVVSDENTAQRVPVSAGAGRGAHIAVEGDIAAGDTVVIRGAERLSEGQALKVLQQDVVASTGAG